MKNKPKTKEIFVTEISFEVEEEDLRKLFSVCGTVRQIRMLNDQQSGKFSGRAFVRMESEAQAKEAINMLDGTLLINRCIGVCAAREKLKEPPVVEEVKTKPPRRERPKRRRQ